MRKPDVSKLARSTEDALVDAGLIADDARIVQYERLAKVFPGDDEEALASPGVCIVIRELTGSVWKQYSNSATVLASRDRELFETTEGAT